MSIEQIIARQEEEFKKKVDLQFLDCHGTACSPVEINKCFCEVQNKIDRITGFHSSSIKEILEGVVRIEKGKKKDDNGTLLDVYQEQKEDGWNDAKSDTINYIEEWEKELWILCGSEQVGTAITSKTPLDFSVAKGFIMKVLYEKSIKVYSQAVKACMECVPDALSLGDDMYTDEWNNCAGDSLASMQKLLDKEL